IVRQERIKLRLRNQVVCTASALADLFHGNATQIILKGQQDRLMTDKTPKPSTCRAPSQFRDMAFSPYLLCLVPPGTIRRKHGRAKKAVRKLKQQARLFSTRRHVISRPAA